MPYLVLPCCDTWFDPLRCGFRAADGADRNRPGGRALGWRDDPMSAPEANPWIASMVAGDQQVSRERDSNPSRWLSRLNHHVAGHHDADCPWRTVEPIKKVIEWERAGRSEPKVPRIRAEFLFDAAPTRRCRLEEGSWPQGDEAWRHAAIPALDRITADDLLQPGARLLVEGPSGSGKTWLLARLAADRRGLYVDDFPEPQGDREGDSLVDLAIRAMRGLADASPGEVDRLRSRLRLGCGLVLLDRTTALDRPRQDRLASLVQNHRGCAVVFAAETGLGSAFRDRGHPRVAMEYVYDGERHAAATAAEVSTALSRSVARQGEAERRAATELAVRTWEFGPAEAWTVDLLGRDLVRAAAPLVVERAGMAEFVHDSVRRFLKAQTLDVTALLASLDDPRAWVLLRTRLGEPAVARAALEATLPRATEAFPDACSARHPVPFWIRYDEVRNLASVLPMAVVEDPPAAPILAEAWRVVAEAVDGVQRRMKRRDAIRAWWEWQPWRERLGPTLDEALAALATVSPALHGVLRGLLGPSSCDIAQVPAHDADAAEQVRTAQNPVTGWMLVRALARQRLAGQPAAADVLARMADDGSEAHVVRGAAIRAFVACEEGRGRLERVATWEAQVALRPACAHAVGWALSTGGRDEAAAALEWLLGRLDWIDGGPIGVAMLTALGEGAKPRDLEPDSRQRVRAALHGVLGERDDLGDTEPFLTAFAGVAGSRDDVRLLIDRLPEPGRRGPEASALYAISRAVRRLDATDADAVRDLLSTALARRADADDANVRRPCVSAIAQFHRRWRGEMRADLVDRSAARLDDPDPATRAQAIRALLAASHLDRAPAAWDRLLAWVRSARTTPDDRRSALQAGLESVTRRGLALLCLLAREDEDGEIRRMAAKSVRNVVDHAMRNHAVHRECYLCRPREHGLALEILPQRPRWLELHLRPIPELRREVEGWWGGAEVHRDAVLRALPGA